MLAALVLLGSAVGGSQPARGEGRNLVSLYPPGSFEFGVAARFAPKALPAEVRSPVGFEFSLDVQPTGPEHIAHLKEIVLKFARDVSVETRGLPICPVTALEEADVEAACPDAIVGRGRSNFEIAFPEQGGHITTSGGVTVVSGVGGPRRSKLYALGSISKPAPAAVAIPIEVTRVPGFYGTRLAMAIPKVVRGAGALSELDLAFSRRKRGESLFSARCAEGELPVLVIARFLDGSIYKAPLQPRCSLGNR